MQTNNNFSIQRFTLLAKQSHIVNKKTIWLSLAGISGIVFLLLLLFQKMGDFNNWSNNAYFGAFTFFFFTLGVIYSSLSFSAFRSKEKSITYLTLPTSTSEKFLYELLSRVISFIILFPILFWVIANIEGSIVHYYTPSFIHYKFSFSQFLNDHPTTGWEKLAIIQSSLFAFSAAFTGASHFSKLPLIKSMFTFSVIVIGFLLFTYLLSKGFDLENYKSIRNNELLFFKNKKDSIAYYAIFATLANLSLLAIAWFRLKEKEV